MHGYIPLQVITNTSGFQVVEQSANIAFSALVNTYDISVLVCRKLQIMFRLQT